MAPRDKDDDRVLERDELKALLASPGWLRLLQLAERAWGDAVLIHKMREACDQVAFGDSAAAGDVCRQGLAQQKAVRDFLAAAGQRLEELTTLLAQEAATKAAQDESAKDWRQPKPKS